jgi:two-component system, NtrC family, sensor kinase
MTAALAGIFILFIVLTEVSVNKLTRAVMVRHVETETTASQDGSSDALEQDLLRLRKPVLFYLITGAATALLLAFLAVHRLAVRPLRRLSAALEKVGKGRLDTTVPISGGRETAEIGRAFNQMTAKLKAQQKELENRLARIEQSARELSCAQDSLIRSAKLASVGTLAAGVAHEIGNPLTGLLGLVESLEAGVTPEDEAKFLALMKNEILRIDRVIRELLSYARAPKNDPLHPQQCDFFEVLGNVRSLLFAQSAFDKIKWDVPAKDLSAVLAVSPDDLTQVLLNLFLNAAQAMNGEGRISIDSTVLKKWKKTPDTRPSTALRIHISNTGPSISPADAKQIFDPFFTTSKAGKGTGLGLSVCQNICDKAGGDISLDPTCTEGTRFTVILPVLAAASFH